jgi:putative nucleotidyltransferase with HDIG domain
LWGWSLNTHQSHFENDPAAHEAAGGLPGGHVPVGNFLSVPAMSGTRLVGQIALANKPGGFTKQDVDTVERLTAFFVVAVLRNEAQAELAQTQLMFQAAMEGSQAGVAIADAPDCTLRYINKAGLAIVGVGEAEHIYGMDPERYVQAWAMYDIDGEPMVPAKDPLARAVCHGEKSTAEVVFRSEAGGDRAVLADAAPILDSEGRIQAGMVVFVDITDRRAEQLELERSHTRLEHMVYQVSEAMGRVVEVRDPYTAGHQERTAVIAKAIAVEMALPESEIRAIEMAALVHDIGKLGVPAEILTKPGHLSNIEFEIIKSHSEYGYQILKDIEFPWAVADVVLQHHERLDGSGYPKGLSGDEICLAARVLGVADVVEAMSSHRPYRATLGIDVAIGEIASRPELFDERVAQACVALFESGRLGT